MMHCLWARSITSYTPKERGHSGARSWLNVTYASSTQPKERTSWGERTALSPDWTWSQTWLAAPMSTTVIQYPRSDAQFSSKICLNSYHVASAGVSIPSWRKYSPLQLSWLLHTAPLAHAHCDSLPGCFRHAFTVPMGVLSATA